VLEPGARHLGGVSLCATEQLEDEIAVIDAGLQKLSPY
jgi:hypothetical protein